MSIPMLLRHIMYINGWGTVKNPDVAEEWLKLSAELGHSDAIDEWNKIVADKKLFCATLISGKVSVIDDFFAAEGDKDKLERNQKKKISKCEEFYVKIN